MCKNRLLTIFAVFAACVAVCASCTNKTVPQNKDVSENPDNQIITPVNPDNGTEQENKEENPEIPENGKEIIPDESEDVQDPTELVFTDIAELTTFDNSKYSIAEICKDNGGATEYMYEILDIDGNIVFGPVSEYLFWCKAHETIGIYSEMQALELDGKYTISEHWGHGAVFTYNCLYDVKADKKYILSGAENGLWAEEIQEFPQFTPYIIYDGDLTVSGADGYLTEEFGRYFDEIYWSGVNSESDSFEYGFVDPRGNPVEMGKCKDVPYSFSNGYLAFIKDGKYGYIDEYGTEVTGFIYDAAETAYDGRAWVCENGEWKVINLENY